MKILGIETTCDDTSCAIVENGSKILSLVTHSQASLHAQFGGVVPELASRSHSEAIIPTIKTCLQSSSLSLKQLDLIAFAEGPGLIGSLLVGIQTAHALSFALKKPLIGINHIKAHLYASMMELDFPQQYFPACGLIISGGHTTLLHIENIQTFTPLGHTRDDAAGEAFDKIAKMLQLGYPGGPLVEALAQNGDPNSFFFKAGTIKNDPLSFSFSGLKTAVLYAYQKMESPSSTQIANLCASFQKAVCTTVCEKIAYAISQYNPKAFFFGGGVTQNMTLRKTIATAFPKTPLFFPPKNLCMDNGAMIAGLAYHLQKPVYHPFKN